MPPVDAATALTVVTPPATCVCNPPLPGVGVPCGRSGNFICSPIKIKLNYESCHRLWRFVYKEL